MENTTVKVASTYVDMHTRFIPFCISCSIMITLYTTRELLRIDTVVGKFYAWLSAMTTGIASGYITYLALPILTRALPVEPLPEIEMLIVIVSSLAGRDAIDAIIKRVLGDIKKDNDRDDD